jgi:tetratricopeptide (TPR) repeat protein
MRRVVVAGLALFLPLLGACGDSENAVARGDRLWADSSYEAALAEYRLALRQNARDEGVQLRVAHGYARLGRLDQARDAYRTLLDGAPQYTDQAVYDYLGLARRALARGDRHGVAGGAEAALALRPELPLPDLAPVLARYYADTGDSGRALLFYQRALATARADSVPEILYQLGLLHTGRGNCRVALGYFAATRQRAGKGERAADARWRMGNCAFELAKSARQEGQITEALGYLDTMIELGVPENLLDQAWFERGEILFALGQNEGALEAYRRVLELNRSRGGLLVDKAKQRIDQIRFGT